MFCINYKEKHYALLTEIPLIKIYIYKIENRITFKIEAGYYPELFPPKIMKVFGSTKKEMAKGKNSENKFHLEITAVVSSL